MTDVTLVTRDATLDDMRPVDYADAFAELRQTAGSLDKFIALVGSQYSKAQWNKFEHGELALTRQMRNDIRRGVGLPELPLTITEAVGAASPDAAVWSVGDGIPETVIMVAPGKYDLHVNGSVTVREAVTSVTPKRTPVARPVASKAQDARRVAIGAKWQDVIEAGLKALEEVQP
jgi:hypothetical protein